MLGIPRLFCHLCWNRRIPSISFNPQFTPKHQKPYCHSVFDRFASLCLTIFRTHCWCWVKGPKVWEAAETFGTLPWTRRDENAKSASSANSASSCRVSHSRVSIWWTVFPGAWTESGSETAWITQCLRFCVPGGCTGISQLTAADTQCLDCLRFYAAEVNEKGIGAI